MLPDKSRQLFIVHHLTPRFSAAHLSASVVPSLCVCAGFCIITLLLSSYLYMAWLGLALHLIPVFMRQCTRVCVPCAYHSADIHAALLFINILSLATVCYRLVCLQLIFAVISVHHHLSCPYSFLLKTVYILTMPILLPLNF